MSVGVTLGTNKENAHHGTANVMGNKQSKFKSLKFVGDQTAIASLAEDVDISCDTETTEDERAEIHPKISDIETSCDDHNVRKQILVRSKRKCGHRYTDLGASPESHAHDTHIDLRKISIGKSCNFEPNDDHHDIRSKTDINDKSCENRTELEGVSSSSCIQWGRESENNLVSSSSGLEQLDGKNLGATNKAKRRRNRKRKTCNLKTVLQSRFNLSAISTDSGAITTDSDSSDSVLEMQDNLDITLNRRRKCTDVKSPVKRLFATQLDAVSPVSLKKKPLCQSASNMDNEVLLLGSCSIDTIPNTESSDFSDVSTPLRRSSRIAANLRQLAAVGTTPLSKLDRVMIVLAPDTPDSEKDWTLRKRQVKGRHINSAIWKRHYEVYTNVLRTTIKTVCPQECFFINILQKQMLWVLIWITLVRHF